MTKITFISFLPFLLGAQGTKLSELNQGLALHPQRHLLGKVFSPVPDPKDIDIPEEFDWGSVQDGNGRLVMGAYFSQKSFLGFPNINLTCLIIKNLMTQ